MGCWGAAVRLDAADDSAIPNISAERPSVRVHSVLIAFLLKPVLSVIRVGI